MKMIMMSKIINMGGRELFNQNEFKNDEVVVMNCSRFLWNTPMSSNAHFSKILEKSWKMKSTQVAPPDNFSILNPMVLGDL